jgi:hypothetical protein
MAADTNQLECSQGHREEIAVRGAMQEEVELALTVQAPHGLLSPAKKRMALCTSSE